MSLLAAHGGTGAEASWGQLRDRFPTLRDVAYFQTGSLAPLADCVRVATVAALDAEGTSALEGPAAYAEFHQRAELQRVRLSNFLGVQASEIGWTSNTTTAIRHAIDTLTWNPADTLITTNREHISTRSLQEGLRQRRGATVSVIDASEGGDRLLCELDRALRSHSSPRLLLLSHVSCQDGRKLPIPEAARLAHAYDVPVLVDGAQSLGQFPIELDTLGCDMLVGSAHKWLMGPAGLGFLFVAQSSLVPFDAPFAMSPSSEDAPAGSRIAVAGGLELGTAGLAPRFGLAAALDLLESLDLSSIAHHVAHLTTYLRDELATLQGVVVLSPEDPSVCSGITSFALNGHDHARLSAIVNQLWESHRVVAKVQVEHPSIRVSIAAFNNEDDVFRLVRALQEALAGS